MGVNNTAYTIIGSLVDEQDFWTETEQSVHENCGDVGHGSYCPNCGKSIHAVEVDCQRIDGYEDPNAPNIDYHGRIHGVDVLQARTADGPRFFVIGAIGECEDYNYTNNGVISLLRCDVAFIAEAEEKVRVALTKAGLWDESKFGIWTALHCSY